MESCEEFSDDTSQDGMGTWAPVFALNNTPESSFSARLCSLFPDGFLGCMLTDNPFTLVLLLALFQGNLWENSELSMIQNYGLVYD